MAEENWIKQYWRPIMAWQYTLVCLFDFIIGPLLTMIWFKETGNYIQWTPISLNEAGFYHLSMGAIIGITAWTRGNEKIEKIVANMEEQLIEETSNKSRGRRR
jgi:hypothetical protein